MTTSDVHGFPWTTTLNESGFPGMTTLYLHGILWIAVRADRRACPWHHLKAKVAKWIPACGEDDDSPYASAPLPANIIIAC